MSFKASGPKTRPDRVKPVPEPSSTAPPRYSSHNRTASFSSLSSSDSFVSASSNHEKTEVDDKKTSKAQPVEIVRFSAEEEKSMLTTSNELKAAANRQFAVKDYSSAIGTYDKAVVELPVYLDYELAVLQSNIAACHVQLREWKEAIDSAERGLDHLEKELPMPKPKNTSKTDENKDSNESEVRGASSKKDNKANTNHEESNQIVELDDNMNEQETQELLRQMNLSDERKNEIYRIRAKLLLRRAKAKVMLCDTPTPNSSSPSTIDNNAQDPFPSDSSNPASAPTATKSSTSNFGAGLSLWSNLSTALSDYTLLSAPPYVQFLGTLERKTVAENLRMLPGRIELAKKKEMDEMMGKLKDLGNMCLKPFGLSTDMFRMTQDPKTGGWSMSMDGGKK